MTFKISSQVCKREEASQDKQENAITKKKKHIPCSLNFFLFVSSLQERQGGQAWGKGGELPRTLTTTTGVVVVVLVIIIIISLLLV